MEQNKYRNSLPVRFIYWIDKHTNLLHNMESNRAKWLLEKFPIHEWINNNSNVLDIGCGMGYIDYNLKNFSKMEIHGIDIIDFRPRFILKNINFNYLLGDSYCLPFKDYSFSSVLILVSLHHMWEPEKAIREALRVLKRGGDLIIIEDIISTKYSLQSLITLSIDNIINLSFTKNPNTNKTKKQWLNLFLDKYGLGLIKEYSIKWGPLKVLELGAFWLRK